MIKTICIAGAGTMGTGIAQLSAQTGHQVILFDVEQKCLDIAGPAMQKNLQYLVDKNKISATEKTAVYDRVKFATNIDDCIADMIIEAVIENMETKTDIFNQLMLINRPSTIFASNTSSISVSAMQNKVLSPNRLAGMHFFNPAPVMKLVEVVKGNKTSDETITSIYDMCKRLGKIPVLSKDSPGFIVNRVGRHYYLEALKLVEQGKATIENIDAIMETSGFKMGPFKLIDLIGMDINLTVSETIYNALSKEERFRPSAIQIDKVAKGELGKKTGKGFYQY